MKKIIKIISLTTFFALAAVLSAIGVFAASGSDYTSIAPIASALNEVFSGDLGLYSDYDTTRAVSAPLGSRTVAPGKTFYISEKSSGAVFSGSSCYIYANAVYNQLFGEVPFQGDVSRMKNARIAVSPCSSVSYELFKAQKVRVGAVLRTTSNSSGKYNSNYGHSVMILDYGRDYITYLEGNGDGKGLIRVKTRTWKDFNNSLLYSKGYVISYVIQPTEEYYLSLSNSSSDSDYISNFSRVKIYSGFSDVPSWTWYRSYISSVYETGLMTGRSSSRFAPEDNVTVAEAVTIAARIHSIYNGNGDIEPSSSSSGYPWYGSYLYYAVANGIKTWDWSDFDRSITREEFAVLLAAALPSSELEAVTAMPVMQDLDTGDFGYSAIYTLCRAGVLSGHDDGLFRPGSPLRRCEAAAAAARMTDRSLRIK